MQLIAVNFYFTAGLLYMFRMLHHLSTNVTIKINYVDAKYALYTILYFDGCGRVYKKKLC